MTKSERMTVAKDEGAVGTEAGGTPAVRQPGWLRYVNVRGIPGYSGINKCGFRNAECGMAKVQSE